MFVASINKLNDYIMKEDYGFIYHYNTYSKLWGAMTVESVGFYFNGETTKGSYVLGRTRAEARDLLNEKLK
jgi:hypothetical protein